MSERVTHNIRSVGSVFWRKQHGGYKYHIVGYCRDEEQDMFVYVVRYFGKHHHYWHYEAFTAEEYDYELEYGLLKEKKK